MPHGEEETSLIEERTFLIYGAMTSSSRHYHDLSHIFVVAKHLPALGKIAAIYHDIIYYHVDGGFPPNVSERIGDVIDCRDGGIFLASSCEESVAEVASLLGLLPDKSSLHSMVSMNFSARCWRCASCSRFSE